MAATLWLLFAATERALALGRRFPALPTAPQWTVGSVLALSAAAGFSAMCWLLRPLRQRLPMPDRDGPEQRIKRLREHGVDTGARSAGLGELDRRRLDARISVALFGEISTGKSSLIHALARSGWSKAHRR